MSLETSEPMSSGTKWMVAGCICVFTATGFGAQRQESVFIDKGVPKLVLEDRVESSGCKPGKWTRGPGYLESREDANVIFAGKSFGAGDFHSPDGGQSFKRAAGAENLYVGGCQASIVRYSSKDTGGEKNIVLFSNPCHPMLRVNLAVRASFDEGFTWPVKRVVDPGGAQYSCLVVLPDGDIGVMYEDAGKSKLTFTRFSLDWLTGTNDIKNQP